MTGKWYSLDRATKLLANPSFSVNIRSSIPAAPPMNTETDIAATIQGPCSYRIGVR